MKIKKKNIIILSIFLIVIISIFVLIGFFISKTNQNPYGSRCDDALEHKISSKTIKSIKSKFKEIDKVDSVDVYTKLCTVKIIVNLKEDVDLDTIKNSAKEIFGFFDEEELAIYDFALYVTSDNKESEIYPKNVSKHVSREDFAWQVFYEEK